MPTKTDLSELMKPVLDFLQCRTPKAWIDAAITDIPTLLVDHANCEKKAASTALGLMYRYTDNFDLLNKMSRLAREELRHFEQVIAIMKKRGIDYEHLSPSRYAGGLHGHIRKEEPGKLVDTLITGAIIEARSCERFYSLIPFLDEELASFYQSLLKSEARHYSDYLKLAKSYSGESDLEPLVQKLLDTEESLVMTEDQTFRFHSGITS